MANKEIVLTVELDKSTTTDHISENYKYVFSSNNMIMIWRAVGFHWHCDGIVFHYDGFLPGHEGDILCMDHNEQLLATGSADKTVKLWSGVSKIHRGNGFTTVSADVLTKHPLGT